MYQAFHIGPSQTSHLSLVCSCAAFPALLVNDAASATEDTSNVVPRRSPVFSCMLTLGTSWVLVSHILYASSSLRPSSQLHVFAIASCQPQPYST